jgi:hypothetical protein
LGNGPAAKALVKLDPAFGWDTRNPNRIQLIRVSVSDAPQDPIAPRREAMARTKASLDYAALAKLLD